MARLLLVRHGESVWNGERRIQGHRDPPLSPRGREQAERLLRALVDRISGVAAVYTSPLRRAAETAERIGALHGLPVVPDPDLREMALGAWEGMTVTEIAAASPGAYERWLADPDAAPAPGGETATELAARVRRAVACMGQQHPGRDLVLVSHGGPIKAIVCEALGLDPRHLFRIKQDNTAVSIVERGPGVRRVLLLNDTCHLRDAGAALVARDVLTDAGDSAEPLV